MNSQRRALISAEVAYRYQVLPLQEQNGILHLGSAGQLENAVIQEISFLLNREVRVADGYSSAEIVQGLSEIFGDLTPRDSNGPESGAQEFQLVKSSTKGNDDGPSESRNDQSIVPIVNSFLNAAARMKASDVHLEHSEKQCRIRFRIDGKLIFHSEIPVTKRQAVISRLKIMANLDIAEKRRPQDGRIRITNGNKTIDIRVSTMPTEFGEKVVLRLLDKHTVNHDINLLGIEDSMLDVLKEMLHRPYGMILVTGPTGSGKTTTLYSALNYLNQNDVNIITIEDPVEYHLPGINQTMVRAQIGLTFANLLRTILRQDPDIIMVGEIRDPETAEIAVQSALTGHLVLSTLHTNDAISTIVRLIDLEVEPFLIASAVRLIVAQRLLRKICPGCRREAQPDRSLLARYSAIIPANTVFYEGRGCSRCHQSGYLGREAVLEQFVMDDDFAELILRKCGPGEFRRLAAQKRLPTLANLAFGKALLGQTTLQEVARETLV